MRSLCTCGMAWAIVVVWPLTANAVDSEAMVAQATPIPPPPSASGASAQTLDKVEIIGTRQRLDAARNGLSPDTGSTIYRFSGRTSPTCRSAKPRR